MLVACTGVACLFWEKNKSGWADSNRRLPRPKRGALPPALHPDALQGNLSIRPALSHVKKADKICHCCSWGLDKSLDSCCKQVYFRA